MRTRDCVYAWVDRMLKGESGRPLKANSCHSDGNYFVSYSTPVARYVDGKFEVATRKYSVTTSKLQNYIRGAIPSSLIVEVPEIGSCGSRPWYTAA